MTRTPASLALAVALAAVALAGTAQAAVSPTAAGLHVTIAAPGSLGKAERPIVTVTFTNDGAADVYLLRWQTPFGGPHGKLFDVRRDGQAVAYVGPLYKFATPAADDYMRLGAGESRTVRVDLARDYDFSRTGEYTLRYQVALQDALRDAAPVALAAFAPLPSNTAVVGVERDDDAARFAEALRTPPVKAASNAYVKCTTSEQSDLVTARGNASTYAGGAISYLNGHTYSTAGARYTTWFGAKDATRYQTVSAHYPAIKNVFDTQAMTFYCNCNQKKTYAFVYPDKPYEVHLCGAFWTAPATGTDSKAGTLVHETSHFNNTAGTNDWAYGQSACKSLATSNPAEAIDNADSHEYFAENNPALN